MSASDWYAQRLGTQRPTGASGSGSTPPVWPHQQSAPGPAYGPPPQPQIPQADLPMGEDDGKMHVGDAITRWRGGAGTKTETQRCPNCGSANFFSRRGQSVTTQNGVMPPAPHCMECGHNGGVFVMFGGGDGLV